MQRILKFIKNYKEYFTFAFLVIVSLSIISVGDVTKLGGFRTVVIGSLGWLQDVFSWIPDTGALKSENKALRHLNLQLSNEVITMRTAIIENTKLRELIDLKKDIKYETETAEIIGKSNIELRNYYTLNKGENDGIREGMAVRSDAGLVGIIAGITKKYSLVELVINKNVKIAAMLQRSRYDGILAWDGGNYFSLKNIPKSYDIKVGDTVVTSNFSNKYPCDIPIGHVVSTSDLPGDIYARINVRPFVNFTTLEQAFVLKYIPDIERRMLIQDIDNKLKIRKNAAAY
ncbi:rod shape-determining protein MreC [Bacteroidota bacterium]